MKIAEITLKTDKLSTYHIFSIHLP